MSIHKILNKFSASFGLIDPKQIHGGKGCNIPKIGHSCPLEDLKRGDTNNTDVQLDAVRKPFNTTALYIFLHLFLFLSKCIPHHISGLKKTFLEFLVKSWHIWVILDEQFIAILLSVVVTVSLSFYSYMPKTVFFPQIKCFQVDHPEHHHLIHYMRNNCYRNLIPHLTHFHLVVFEKNHYNQQH